MTTQEFSDSFDTLLNSYASQAAFGEQAAKSEIVLDEYEKSVLLTQAQDIVVKSYFDARANSTGEGFDDSAKRQVDFSSLIKVEDLQPVASPKSTSFDDRGIVYEMPRRKSPDGEIVEGSTDVLFILNEKLTILSGSVLPAKWSKEGQEGVEGSYTDDVAKTLPYNLPRTTAYEGIEEAEADGWSWAPLKAENKKDFVIVPINFKEYDREMSKAYAQPLKKQAWRLFQNKAQGFDVNTELIPKFDIVQTDLSKFIYRIRYVKRPEPIVLTNLPNGLTVDGVSDETPCELNPILHPEILQKAVELAVTTRGGVAPRQREEQRQRQ